MVKATACKAVFPGSIPGAASRLLLARRSEAYIPHSGATSGSLPFGVAQGFQEPTDPPASACPSRVGTGRESAPDGGQGTQSLALFALCRTEWSLKSLGSEKDFLESSRDEKSATAQFMLTSLTLPIGDWWRVLQINGLPIHPIRL